MSNIIHLNESELKNQLGELVRGTVEETLNKLLDAEADKITPAATNGAESAWIPVPATTPENS